MYVYITGIFEERGVVNDEWNTRATIDTIESWFTDALIYD
jgi:hypothetical protein